MHRLCVALAREGFNDQVPFLFMVSRHEGFLWICSHFPHDHDMLEGMVFRTSAMLCSCNGNSRCLTFQQSQVRKTHVQSALARLFWEVGLKKYLIDILVLSCSFLTRVIFVWQWFHLHVLSTRQISSPDSTQNICTASLTWTLIMTTLGNYFSSI